MSDQAFIATGDSRCTREHGTAGVIASSCQVRADSPSTAAAICATSSDPQLTAHRPAGIFRLRFCPTARFCKQAATNAEGRMPCGSLPPIRRFPSRGRTPASSGWNVPVRCAAATSWSPLVEAPDRMAGTSGLWFLVVQCDDCGLCFTNPRASHQSMTQFYASAYPPHVSKASVCRGGVDW